MSSIKTLSAQTLATFLQPFVNDVPVIADQQPYDQDATFPSVVILPLKHRRRDTQIQEINTENTQHLLARVGWMEGQTEIRIYATTASERDLIEQRITEAFFSQSLLRRGVIILELPVFNYGQVNWLDNALCGFDLLDEEWREEMVFTDKRYSFIQTHSTYDLYVNYDIATINEIDIYIRDMDTNYLIEEVKITASP